MQCQTLDNLVETAWRSNADHTAVVFDNGKVKTSLSYTQLSEMSNKVMLLLSGYQCERTVIGLCLQVDQRLPAILLGVLRSRAAFYNFTVTGLEYVWTVLQQMSVQILIVHRTYIQVMQSKLSQFDTEVTFLREAGLEDYILVHLHSVLRKLHPAGMAYCITTSGTTGIPKAVLAPHACIVPNILHLREIFSMTSADLVLAATALTFDPSIVEMFLALSVGACVLIVPPAVKMVPSLLLDMICQRSKVTVLQITPTLLSRFSASELRETILGDNSAIRVIALGGERFPSCSWLHSLMSPGNQTIFYNLYGTTEVSCWATVYRISNTDLQTGGDVPLGEPLLDTVVEVYSESGDPVVDGQGESGDPVEEGQGESGDPVEEGQGESGDPVEEGQGLLWIGGTARQCILDHSEEISYDNTTLVMRNTGDIVRKDNSGHLYFVGRKDSQVKRNGQRIDLEEINMVTRKCSSVQDSAVQLISDKIVVFVVTQDTEMLQTHVNTGMLQVPVDTVMFPPPVDTLMLQPPVDTGMLPSPVDTVIVQVPMDTEMLQTPVDTGMLKVSVDTVMLQVPMDTGMLQPPVDTGMLQPPVDTGMLQPPVDTGMLQTPVDTGMLQVPLDSSALEFSMKTDVLGVDDKVQGYLRDHLPSHWWPDDVVLVPNMPVTPHGKMDINALLKIYDMKKGESHQGVTEYLYKRWKSVLHSDEVTDDMNFLSAGGNSLRAVHLVNDVEQQFNTQIPQLLDILLNNTYADVKNFLAVNIDKGRESAVMSSQDSLFLAKGRQSAVMISQDSSLNPKGKQSAVMSSQDSLLPAKGRQSALISSKDYLLPVKGRQSTEMSSQDSLLPAKWRKLVETDNYNFSMKPQKFESNTATTTFGIDFIAEKQNQNENFIRQDSYESGILSTDGATKLPDKESLKNETSEGVMASDTVKRKHQQDYSKTVYKVSKQGSYFKSSISRTNKICNIGQFLAETVNTCHEENYLYKIASVMDGTINIHIEEVWSCNTGKCVDASPLLAVRSDGEAIVYIGSHSHKFVALKMSTGVPVWEVILPDRLESSACLSSCGKFVIVGCYDGCVYFLHSDTGELWWKFQTGSQVKCSAVVDTQTGLVYIGSHSQNVYCFNVKDRVVVWCRDLASGSVFSSPVICLNPHQLIVATLQGKLFSLNPMSGEMLWSCDLCKPVFSSPALTQHGVCLGCTDMCLYHFSVAGNLLWKFPVSGPIFSSPSVHISTLDRSSPRKITCERTSSSRSLSSNQPLHIRKLADHACQLKENGDKNLIDEFESGQSTSQNLSAKDYLFTDHLSSNLSPNQLRDVGDGKEVDLLCSGEGRLKDNNDKASLGVLTDSTNENGTSRSCDVTDGVVRNTQTVGEYIVFGCHDKCVYCIANDERQVWKLQVDSEVYSSPFQCILPLNSTCPQDTGQTKCTCNNSKASKNSLSPLSYEATNEFDTAIQTEINLKSEINVYSESPLNSKISDENNMFEIPVNCQKDLTEKGVLDHYSLHVNKTGFCGLLDSNIKDTADSEYKSTSSERACCCGENTKVTVLHIVVFASTKGYIYVVHVPTGKILCKKKLNGEIFSSPVVYNDHIVIGCRNDNVYCFKITPS